MFLGNRYLAESCFFRGKLNEAHRYLERCLPIFDPAAVGRRTLENGRVGVLNMLSRTLFGLGYPDQAQSKMQEALSEARQLSHPFTLVSALTNALYVEREITSARVVLKH